MTHSIRHLFFFVFVFCFNAARDLFQSKRKRVFTPTPELCVAHTITDTGGLCTVRQTPKVRA
jgi:hypothetical protein